MNCCDYLVRQDGHVGHIYQNQDNLSVIAVLDSVCCHVQVVKIYDLKCSAEYTEHVRNIYGASAPGVRDQSDP